jgi:hypothetical protein
MNEETILLWNMKRDAIHRMLAAQDILVVSHVCRYLNNLAISNPLEHFIKLEPRINLVIIWHIEAQSWFECDPYHKFYPYTLTESDQDITNLMELGKAIHNSIYVDDKSLPASFHPFIHLWKGILTEPTYIVSWGLNQIREMFVTVQDEIAYDDTGSFKITSFIANLNLWMMKNTGFLLTMTSITVEQEEEFLQAFPAFLCLWVTLSPIRKWYFITVYACWTLEGKGHCYTNRGLWNISNVNYAEALSNVGLIEAKIKWSEHMATRYPREEDFQRDAALIQGFLEKATV